MTGSSRRPLTTACLAVFIVALSPVRVQFITDVSATTTAPPPSTVTVNLSSTLDSASVHHTTSHRLDPTSVSRGPSSSPVDQRCIQDHHASIQPHAGARGFRQSRTGENALGAVVRTPL